MFREELVIQGITENRKLLDQKIEETKNLILLQQQEKEKTDDVNYFGGDQNEGDP